MYARRACVIFRYRSRIVPSKVGQAVLPSVPFQNTINMEWLRRLPSRQTHSPSMPVSPRSQTNPTLTQGISTSDWSKSCIEVQKPPEGNFSKVFLLTMDDGKKMITKLPNPNARPQYFTTASEVATMNYPQRCMLGAPPLKILEPSISLWKEAVDINLANCGMIYLAGPDKFEIVQQLLGFEKALVSTRFPIYGNIYYANNLRNVDSNQMIELGDRKNTVGVEFAVGPTTNRTFFDDGRDAVDVHRGSWTSIEDYVSARAIREIPCLQTFSEFLRPQGLFYGPGQYQHTTQQKQAALQNISKPVLWHPDLHGDNIFVNSDQPTEIISIIDWQAVDLSPLFLQARHPALIDFKGPIPEGLKRIRLPDNFDDLSLEE
ncbi:unnamed protein product [Penicillium nalgiovense]|nr:unnamed protein product [Penicillium nalgiovense]